MKFEFYVLNEVMNRRGKIEYYNIFNNYFVKEQTEKAIKKYLRAPSKFKFIKQYANKFIEVEEIAIYGWEAFVAELNLIIKCEEWSRCEYEIAVGSLFTTEIRDVVRDLDKFETLEDLKAELIKLNERNFHLEKWDCYMQAKPNMEAIAHEVIRQYKEQIKNGKFRDED